MNQIMTPRLTAAWRVPGFYRIPAALGAVAAGSMDAFDPRLALTLRVDSLWLFGGRFLVVWSRCAFQARARHRSSGRNVCSPRRMVRQTLEFVVEGPHRRWMGVNMASVRGMGRGRTAVRDFPNFLIHDKPLFGRGPPVGHPQPFRPLDLDMMSPVLLPSMLFRLASVIRVHSF